MADYAVVKETTLAWGGTMDGTPYWTTYIDNSSGGQFMGNRSYLAQSDCVFLVSGCGINLTAIIGSVRELAHGRNNGGSTMSLAGGILTDGSLSVTASTGTLNVSNSSYDAADNSLQWYADSGVVNNGTSDNFYSGSPLSLTGPRNASASDYGGPGHWAIACDAVICLVPTTPTTLIYTEPVSGIVDAPGIASYALVPYAKPGGTLTASASYGSMAISLTATILKTFGLSDYISANANIQGVIGQRSSTPTMTSGSASLTYSPAPAITPYTGTASRVYTDASSVTQTGSVSITSSGVSVSATGLTYSAGANFSGAATRHWSASGVIWGTDAPLAIPGLKITTPNQGTTVYDSAGNVTGAITQADASSGAWSASGLQRSYDLSAGIMLTGATGETLTPAIPLPANVLEFAPLSFGIDKTTLGTLDSAASIRLLGHGPVNNGASFLQLPFLSLSGVLTVPYAATPANHALPDSGTAAGLTGAEWLNASGFSYRYLKISGVYIANLPAGTSSVNVTLTLHTKMGDRTWSKDKDGSPLTVTASGADFVLDTCAFDTAPGIDGRAETQWTLNRTPDGAGLATGKFDDPHYALSNMSGVSFGAIPAAAHVGDALPTLHSGGLRLLRLESVPKITLLPAWNDLLEYYGPPANDASGNPLGTINYRPFFTALSDGIPSAEATDFYQNIPPVGDPSYSVVTIGGMVSAVNGEYPPGNAHDFPAGGWVASALTPVPTVPIYSDIPNGGTSRFFPISLLLNSTSPAVWLGGAGAIVTSAGWQGQIEQDAGTVSAQLLYDALTISGLCGDALGFQPGSTGAAGEATQLRFHAIFRGAANGMVFSPVGTPANGATVHAGPSTGTNTGQFGGSTSGANGFFPHTGTPAIPPGAADIAAAVGTSHSGITAISRHISRAVLSVLQSAFRFVEVDSARGWLYCGIDNKVRTYHLSNFMLVMPESAAYGAVDEWIRGRLDIRSGTLILLGQQGAHTFSVCRSGDAGQSIAGGLTVTANSAGIESESERGYFVFLYGDSSDNLMRQLSQDVCQTFAAAAAVNDNTGAAMVGKILDLTRDPRSGAFVMSLLQGGSTSVWLSQDAGMTFTQKLS